MDEHTYRKKYIDELLESLERIPLDEGYRRLKGIHGGDYIIGRLSGIISAIKNEDALNILLVLSKTSADENENEIYVGIPATTGAYRSLGMTQKRYYTRLKKLKDERMLTLDKKKRRYFPTPLGIYCVKMMKEFNKIAEKK